jgi:hypothetical protein
MLEEGGELQAGVKLVEAGKRRAIFSLTARPRMVRDRAYGLTLTLGDGDRPAQHGGQALEHLGFDDRRHDQEPNDGIENQRAGEPEAGI